MLLDSDRVWRNRQPTLPQPAQKMAHPKATRGRKVRATMVTLCTLRAVYFLEYSYLYDYSLATGGAPGSSFAGVSCAVTDSTGSGVIAV